jgi:hypothetical protein
METKTDAEPKHGQVLRGLVEARRSELEAMLTEAKTIDPATSANIEAALGALKPLLTGDLDQINPMVAQDLSKWIETHKGLGTGKAPQ